MDHSPTGDVDQRGRGLQSGDLFRLAHPRLPIVSPDERHILFLQEQPDIQTDRVARHVHILDRADLSERRLDIEGDVAFARWAGAGELIVVSADTATPGSAVVRRIGLNGSDVVVGRLPHLPSQIEVSRDAMRAAMWMKRPWPRQAVDLPPQPEGADWSPRARYVDQMLWRIDGLGDLDGNDQLVVMDLQDGTVRQVGAVASTGFYPNGIAWSADGGRVYFSANLRPDWEREQLSCDIHAIDINSGRVDSLTDGFGTAFNPKLSPDGAWLAFLGFAERGQFHHAPALHVMATDGSNHRILVDIRQNIYNHAWDPDGTGLYFSYIRDGVQHLARTDLDGVIVELASGLAADGPFDVEPYIGGGSEFAASGDGVVYIRSTAEEPGQLVERHRSGATRMLKRPNEHWLPMRPPCRIERLEFKSPDGTDIQAWLLYPPNYDPAVLHPLILNIHGGPNLAYGGYFSYRFQRYAAEGYLVLLVNYRGSAGADMRHYEAAWSFPDKEYEDLMAGVDAAMERASVDPDRLFVTGLSAGGILTAWTIGKTARFAAAAVHSPIINQISHALTNDLYAAYTMRSFGTMPWQDPMAYWRRSPLSLVAAIETPTLIIHGDNDSRTPPSEGLQLYHALKILGVPTAMLLLPEAFHIPTRPTQWIEEQEHILRWFASHPRKSARDADPAEPGIVA